MHVKTEGGTDLWHAWLTPHKCFTAVPERIVGIAWRCYAYADYVFTIGGFAGQGELLTGVYVQQ